MKNLMWLVLIAPTFLIGCASIVAPGQTRTEMEASGATLWTVTEYGYSGSWFVWIPHWVEGGLNVSTPHASNVKKMDVLEFRDNVLVARQELGADRDAWAAVLKAHGRLEAPAGGMAPPLYMAVTSRVVNIGAPTEAVLFAAGFPSHGPSANPSVKRSGYEIKRDDVLYYTTSKGGRAQEIVLRDGKVSEVRDAEYASKFWNGFYTR